MGATHVTVQVRALSGRPKPLEAEFLVETGAILSMAPGSKLKKAGIRPTGKGSYELADGSAVELYFGHAILSFMGSVTATDIIFGPEESEPLLGVVALESTGIMVDPVSQTLRRMHALPLK